MSIESKANRALLIFFFLILIALVFMFGVRGQSAAADANRLESRSQEQAERLKEIQTERDRLVAEASRLRIERNDLDASLADRMRAFETAMDRAANAESDLARVRTERNEHLEARNDLRRRLDLAETELIRLQKSTGEAIGNLENQVKAFELELARQRQDFDRVRKESAAKSEQSRKDLTAALDGSRREVAALQARIEGLAASFEERKQEIADLKAENDRLTAAREEMSRRLKTLLEKVREGDDETRDGDTSGR